MKLKKMGGSVVSNNITSQTGELKWCIREQPLNKVDNGWRFLSNIDDDEFLSNSDNMSIWDFSTIVEIEPAILSIYEMPVGTDATLIRENGKKFFVHTQTGKRID